LPVFRPPQAGTEAVEAIARARSAAAASWTSPGVDLKHSSAMKERPNDTEFTPSLRRSAAVSETDAVTAVMYELGHVTEHDDLEESDDEHDLTYAWLQPNLRKTFTSAAIVDEVFAEL
ncbi:MAG: hypothetical protein VB835_05005, partial [Pirellulales bacterium]